MQPFNSAAYTSLSKRNRATSLHQTYTPSLLPAAWGSQSDVDDPGQRFSDNSMLSHVLGVQQQYRMTVPTGCHDIPDNSLPFHFKTTDSEQFHYPPEAQDLIPSTADNILDHGYVLSNTDFPWFDPGKVISQPSKELLLAMKPPEVSSRSLGTYHVCHWIESGVHCGQTISGVTHGLSTHLRDAHNIKGNEKRMLVCHWLDCGQMLQRGGMKRHVVTRHLDNKSRCYHCFKAFSRQDAMKKHARNCQGVPLNVVGSAQSPAVIW